MEIKNLEKAGQRIKKAITHNEKFILYGDADLDGVCSLIILKDTLKNLNGKIAAIYFPSREEEGYGLSFRALDFLKKFAPALLITLDCGISNFEQIKLANSLGFETIIIDHHEILEKLPEASIIVNPKQKGDKYPFKGLATAGIVYKLSQFLLKNRQSNTLSSKEELSSGIRREFLELVALATLADLMPEKEDNKSMIEEGLFFLENSWRPAFKVFLEREKKEGKNSIREIVQKMISTLNISDLRDHLAENFLFLTSKSEKEAKEMLQNLLEKSYQRQLKIDEIIKELRNRLSNKEKEPLIFEGDANWPLSLIGSVASRIRNFYQKPVFIYRKGEVESWGAVRTLVGVDGVELMKKCAFYLKTYGGHPQAAGFSIKNEKLEEFKECLVENYSKLKP